MNFLFTIIESSFSFIFEYSSGYFISFMTTDGRILQIGKNKIETQLVKKNL